MQSASETARTIKDEVKAHYTSAIKITTGGCCGSGGASCGSETELYGTEMLKNLPAGINSTSFGCGNPIAIAGLNPGERVLDLGSGAGLDVFLAAQRVGNQGRVYGLDMTDAMLEVAQENARKGGFANVVFLKGDIEAIPLPAGSVDVIISNCVVNLAPSKETVLKEAYRVLAHGGRLAISDIVIDGDLSVFGIDEETIRAGLSWAGCIAGALSIQTLTAILKDIGFTDVRVDIGHRFTKEDLGGPLPDALAGMPEKQIIDLVARFTSSQISAVKPR